MRKCNIFLSYEAKSIDYFGICDYSPNKKDLSNRRDLDRK